MKNRDEMKIVLIGMGYLMEYIAPCYQRLLGGRLWEQSKGVTADPVGLERKAQATGVPVVLNDNLGALRDVHPDIIFFSPLLRNNYLIIMLAENDSIIMIL